MRVTYNYSFFVALTGFIRFGCGAVCVRMEVTIGSSGVGCCVAESAVDDVTPPAQTAAKLNFIVYRS